MADARGKRGYVATDILVNNNDRLWCDWTGLPKRDLGGWRKQRSGKAWKKSIAGQNIDTEIFDQRHEQNQVPVGKAGNTSKVP